MRQTAWLLLAGCAARFDPSTMSSDTDCLTDADEASHGTDPLSPDSDGDGLDDCTEVGLGTDPLAADSDGDGLPDLAEVTCVSDPNDAASVCYACGWGHDDPGNLGPVGVAEGDTIEDIALIDQCGETVPLWDFAQEYHILFMTAAW
jgi:hypothetical protein